MTATEFIDNIHESKNIYETSQVLQAYMFNEIDNNELVKEKMKELTKYKKIQEKASKECEPDDDDDDDDDDDNDKD